MRWLIACVRWIWKKALLAFATLGLGGACDAGLTTEVAESNPSASATPETVELVGIDGRRLADSDTYVVPLDGGRRPLAVGEVFREAFVVLNDAPVNAEIAWLTLTDVGAAGEGEWRLVAPTRAVDLPLPEGPMHLAAGGRFDFDVRFVALGEGPARAVLELAVAGVHGLAILRVTLTGRVARGPPSP